MYIIGELGKDPSSPQLTIRFKSHDRDPGAIS